MLVHAKQDLPNECCGLILGTPHSIENVVRARNLKASPNRYQIDPLNHFAAIRRARVERLHLIGAYHSHPSGPTSPSATDLEEAMYQEYLYVIVSPARDQSEGRISAYRLAGERFELLKVVVR